MAHRTVITIGIIGAGAIGSAVATCALLGGYRVMLEDISRERLARAKACIDAAVDVVVMGRQAESARGADIRANLSISASIDELSRSADLLIEAAPDDAELQLEIFTIFDKFAKPGAIFATTARSVPIAELAEMTNCPERCVCLQFPDLGSRDRTLRIVAAPKTAERTLESCADFARTLGLAPVISGEAAPAPSGGESRKS